MAEILVMPKLGLTMEEGYLASWLCEPGAQVALGQPICESPYAGVLLRCIEPGGDAIPVGEPIAVIGEPGEDANSYRLYQGAGGDAPVPAAREQAVPAPPPSKAAKPKGEAAASPLARRIAATVGIDLADVEGTGPEGRITREDVERAAAALGRPVPTRDGSPA
jgi:pyruvate dehydrogenase E2 component (dihydrolipoamide acetyltransferase)